MAQAKTLSDRAKHRLRIAAEFLRRDGIALDCPRDQFYDVVQAKLATLNTDKQALLKSFVDWVEAYDNTSSVPSPTAPRSDR